MKQKRKKRRTVSDYSELGKYIAHCCIDSGVSNAALADKLGIQQHVLSAMLFGDYQPGVATIYLLSQVIDCDVNTLVKLAAENTKAYAKRIEKNA